MNDHRVTALVLLVVCGLTLLFGVATGGIGYWDRESRPPLYWSTMILFCSLGIVSLWNLIAG